MRKETDYLGLWLFTIATALVGGSLLVGLACLPRFREIVGLGAIGQERNASLLILYGVMGFMFISIGLGLGLLAILTHRFFQKGQSENGSANTG